MRAINHAITGAIIGLSASTPIALTLAFASHFAVDALPHHADPKQSNRRFTLYLAIDIILCGILAAIIFSIKPTNWLLAIICAALATSPDIMWFREYLDRQSGKKSKPVNNRSSIVRLHASIQWFQKPIGAIVEVIWGSVTTVVLFFLLRS